MLIHLKTIRLFENRWDVEKVLYHYIVISELVKFKDHRIMFAKVQWCNLIERLNRCNEKHDPCVWNISAFRNIFAQGKGLYYIFMPYLIIFFHIILK